MRRIALSGILAVAFAAAVAAAPLARGRALAVMHERHEGMEKIGDTNKLLRRELQSSAPFMPAVKSGAATIANLSRQCAAWFPAGTGPEVGKTGAKPNIWQDPKDFAAKVAAFQKAAQLFHAAAEAGEMNAIKARYAALGDTCNACHDKFRTDMHH